MINQISDYTIALWKSRKTKSSSAGWISGNAPCCIHNGESADTRGRGGLIYADNKLTWHCFNCSYKASYIPGRPLTFKFRKLLGWLGASDGEVKRLVIEAIRIKDLVGPSEHKEEIKEEIVIKARTLPDNIQSFSELTTLHPAAEYCYDRKIDLTKYNFYVTESKQYSLYKRVIIPCYWKNSIIGYTARAFTDDVKPKYHNNYESNFVFNTDQQQRDWKFVIVCEGPFDAMAVDGVAVLGNDISEIQADIIDSLGREVIVVADTDVSGAKTIDAAIKYGWSVSFPIWQEDADCKDISAAVVKYGKLFVLKSIIDAKETSKLKIELMRKRTSLR